MKTKTNQIFFHGTNSNLMSRIFYQKNIKVFQRYSKSKFLNFMTKVNQTKKKKQNCIFFHRTFKFDIIFHWLQNT